MTGASTTATRHNYSRAIALRCRTQEHPHAHAQRNFTVALFVPYEYQAG